MRWPAVVWLAILVVAPPVAFVHWSVPWWGWVPWVLLAGIFGPYTFKAAAMGYLTDGHGTPLTAVARAGNVGGTARWAALGYRTLSPQDPDLTVGSLIETLLRTRFAAEAGINPAGSAARAWLAMGEIEIRGLAHLVVLVLTAEAGFADNQRGVQREFVRVVRDELAGGDVPGSYALGPDADAGLDPDLLLERFGPSMAKLQRLLA